MRQPRLRDLVAAAPAIAELALFDASERCTDPVLLRLAPPLGGKGHRLHLHRVDPRQSSDAVLVEGKRRTVGLADGILMAVFSYLYLFGIHSSFWISLPAPEWLAAILPGYGVAILLALGARKLLARPRSTLWPPPTLMLFAAGILAATFVADVWSWHGSGLRPSASGQGATVYAFLALQGVFTAIGVLMALYLAARNSRGLVTRPRNNSFDLTMLFISYAGAEGALAAALVRLSPGAF